MRTYPISVSRNNIFQKITQKHCKPSVKELRGVTLTHLIALNNLMEEPQLIIKDGQNERARFDYIASIPCICLKTNPNTKYSYSENTGHLSTDDFEMSLNFNKKTKITHFKRKQELDKTTILSKINEYVDLFINHFDNDEVVEQITQSAK